MSGDIHFENVTPIGPPPEPSDEPKQTTSADVLEVVRREADFLRGKADAYLEILGLLEATQDGDSDEESG